MCDDEIAKFDELQMRLVKFLFKTNFAHKFNNKYKLILVTFIDKANVIK